VPQSLGVAVKCPPDCPPAMFGVTFIFGVPGSGPSQTCGSNADMSTMPGAHQITRSHPLGPSTRNSVGCLAKKCFKPKLARRRYARAGWDKAIPSMESSNWYPSCVRMCSRHSVNTRSRSMYSMAASTGAAAAASCPSWVRRLRCLPERSEHAKTST